MKTIQLAKLSESEWLRARHPYLGSSDLPTLLGEGYAGSTYWSVYHEKKQPEPNLDDDLSISNRMWWGRQMQKIIGAAIVREHGWTLKEGSTLVVDEERRISATNDFDVVHPERGPGIIETKNRDWLFWRDHYTEDKAFVYDEIQLAQQLLLHPKHDWGMIAVCVGGNELREYPYTRAELEQHMTAIKDAALEFWRRFEEDDEPAITFQDIPAWVLARGPELAGPEEPFELPGDITDEGTAAALTVWRNSIPIRKQADKMEKAAKAAVLQAMGDHRRAHFPGFIVKQSRAEIAERVCTEEMVGDVLRKASIRTTLTIEELTSDTTKGKPTEAELRAGEAAQAPLK
tara:strand:+ start:175 stop:1209 length:1035 start_codon:yes stop_codon:yes gene_type:complete